MRKILILDTQKASLVMTSEAFKDLYPGVQVLVARTEEEALTQLALHNDIQAGIIDFDFSQAAGAKVAEQMQALSAAPLLVTVWEREGITKELAQALYPSCVHCTTKPIQMKEITDFVQRFCDVPAKQQSSHISCHLPAWAEVHSNEPIPLYVSGTIAGCSLKGVQLKSEASPAKEWHALVASIQKKAKPSADYAITVRVPLKGEQTLKGHIRATHRNKGEWTLEIEFENKALSQRLYESVKAAGQGAES